jgi:hypothetical protein
MGHISFCAGDINLVDGNTYEYIIKKNTEALANISKEIGVEVNAFLLLVLDNKIIM